MNHTGTELTTRFTLTESALPERTLLNRNLVLVHLFNHFFTLAHKVILNKKHHYVRNPAVGINTVPLEHI